VRDTYHGSHLRLEQDRRNQLLLHSTTGYVIYMLDASGNVSTWNAGAQLAKGYTADEIIGKPMSVFYTPEDRQSGEPETALKVAIESGCYRAEMWRVRKDGSRFWASVSIEPVYEAGTLVGFAKLTKDVYQGHEANDRLTQTHRNLDLALTHMCQGLALYDANGCLILANDRLSQMFSISSDRIQVGMTVSEVMIALGFSSQRAKKIQSRIHALLPSDDADHTREESNSRCIVSMATRRMPEGGWVTTFEDMTERRKLEQQLAHLIHHDTLTGLPNRTLFRVRLREAVARKRRNLPFALLIIDIDDFSAINATLGQAVGDQLLKAVAQRMKQHVREIDTVARLDGDEFAILQSGPEVVRDTEALANRLIEGGRIPYVIDGRNVVTSLNIGIALGTGDGKDVDDLLKEADLALCRAKLFAGSSYSFFSPELDREMQSRRAVEKDLGEALGHEEFQLHYQALADAQTGQIRGYEALLRWRHPSRGWISPAEFIPIAEESGLIVPIGEWVLRTACAEAAKWPCSLNVAVNLSPVQFAAGTLSQLVMDALTNSGLEADRLELEITESLLLRDNEANLASLGRLKEMGIRIALDDFGIGYSSLSYLRSFQFDKLKIDQSFVRDLPESGSAKAIVSAIIGLGKSFNIDVTAEGVETAEQLEYLRVNGCQEVQGFFISQPQSAQDLCKLLTDTEVHESSPFPRISHQPPREVATGNPGLSTCGTPYRGLESLEDF
jgi:diguanylate cyclase (GGDEF)-like protein/PAS domain S-box-containing protein